MKCRNGIIIFDEYEKANEKVALKMYEITDPEQNHSFEDEYFGFPQDLSSIWFILSMNQPPKDRALSDRVHIINVPGYKFEEKVQIAMNYTLPSILKNRNITDITMPQESAEYLVSLIQSKDPNDKGIRKIKHSLDNIVMKISYLLKTQLSSGDRGELNISYDRQIFKNLKFPIVITKEMIDVLTKDDNQQSQGWRSIYM